MDRSTKATRLAELKEKFAEAAAAVVLDFSGTSVNDINEVRSKLREKEVDYYVVKNTLARMALPDTNISVLEDTFKGPTAIALSYDDPSAPAKVLTEVAKELKTLEFKAAMVDGQRYEPTDLDKLAKLPSKDDIRAKLLATLMAPAQQLAGVLHAPSRDMVLVLKAYEDSQNEG